MTMIWTRDHVTVSQEGTSIIATLGSANLLSMEAVLEVKIISLLRNSATRCVWVSTVTPTVLEPGVHH